MKFHEKMRNQFGFSDRKQFSPELWNHIRELCKGCPWAEGKPPCTISHENLNTRCQCGKPIWNVYSITGRIMMSDLGSECLRAIPCYKLQKALDRKLP